MGSGAAVLNGHCTCRACAYRLLDAPLVVHACHCRWCQRETGSAFVLNAVIEARRVELTAGSPVLTTVPSESGRGQDIHRCPDCHVALWSVYRGLGPRFLFVRAGTLETPEACPPDVHIYTGSKLSWIHLPEDVPVQEEYYRRSDIWPEAALARRLATLALSDADAAGPRRA
ncbi:MAG: GFA family protein [Pseudomonadota bacterium]